MGAVRQHTNRQGCDRPDEGSGRGEQAKFGVVSMERFLQLRCQGPDRAYVGTLEAEHSSEQEDDAQAGRPAHPGRNAVHQCRDFAVDGLNRAHSYVFDPR